MVGRVLRADRIQVMLRSPISMTNKLAKKVKVSKSGKTGVPYFLSKSDLLVVGAPGG